MDRLARIAISDASITFALAFALGAPISQTTEATKAIQLLAPGAVLAGSGIVLAVGLIRAS